MSATSPSTHIDNDCTRTSQRETSACVVANQYTTNCKRSQIKICHYFAKNQQSLSPILKACIIIVNVRIFDDAVTSCRREHRRVASGTPIRRPHAAIDYTKGQQCPAHSPDHNGSPRHGSTRSTRRASPTRTATASATFPASSPDSTTSATSAATPCGSTPASTPPSRMPDTTYATISRSPRAMVPTTTSSHCSTRPIGATCTCCSTWSPAIPARSIRGSASAVVRNPTSTRIDISGPIHGSPERTACRSSAAKPRATAPMY